MMIYFVRQVLRNLRSLHLSDSDTSITSNHTCKDADIARGVTFSCRDINSLGVLGASEVYLFQVRNLQRSFCNVGNIPRAS